MILPRLLGWSLRHRRWRRVLDVVMMTVTAGVVMIFVSAMAALLTYVHGSAGQQYTRVLIKPKMMDADLPTSLFPMLQGIEGVQVAQRYKGLAGRHPSGATYLVLAEEDSGVELTPDLLPVEPAVFEAWKKERPMGAIVTEATARDLDLKVGEVADVPTARGPLRIKVVGLSYGASIGQRIAPHFDYLMEFLHNPGTCRFRVYTKPADYERVAAAVEERTQNTATPLQAINAAQFAASIASQVGMVPAVLGFLGLFLILTTILTLVNNSAIAIRERRSEIATMRVLGYRRRMILKMLLCEAMLVGLVGGVIAIALAALVFRHGLQLTPGEAQLLAPVRIGRLGIVTGLVISAVLPVLGMLPSALSAVRMPLIDALRDPA